MRVAILTSEYPPHIYGGAGVHVDYLTRELARLDDGRHRVHVLCFGEQHRDEGSLRVDGVQAPVAAQARRRVEPKFGWASIARQTLEYYEEVIARGRSRPHDSG